MNNKTKKVTIADLAKMIKEDVVDKMATKEELKSLEAKMATKSDIDELKTKIEKIDKRLDYYAEKKVGYDKFNPLVKKVDALEKA